MRNWFFLVVALFLLDTVVPGVHFLWFRMAAVATGVLALATGMAWKWQLLAFGIFSVAAAFWVRRFAQPDHLRSDLPDLNARGRRYRSGARSWSGAIECGAQAKVRDRDSVVAGGGL